MIDIYICEDHAREREWIRNKIENIIAMEQLDMEIGWTGADPQALLQKASEAKNCGLYFLDIDLNLAAMNGLYLAQEIRKLEPRCFIVFVTSHGEMSTQTYAYKAEALDFIVKEAPEHMGERLRECLLSVSARYGSGSCEHKKIFSASLPDGRIVQMPFEEIISIETCPDSRRLILYSEKRRLEFRGTITDTECVLDKRFFRCHRSVIVNLDHVKEWDMRKKLLIMDNENIYPVSIRETHRLTELFRKRVCGGAD